MPFGYPREIFRYPAVQYIPLQMFNIINGPYPLGGNTRFDIYTPSEIELLRKKLKNLNVKEKYSLNSNQLAILVFNGIIDIIMYRGYEVFIVSFPKDKEFFLCKITTDYFYKNNLIFTLYNGGNGEKIDRENYLYLKNVQNKGFSLTIPG